MLAPVAIITGRASRRRIDAGGGAVGGYRLATAGLVAGVVGTTLWLTVILWSILTFTFSRTNISG